MVPQAKKTSVLVLIPRLFDWSQSRTVDTLVLRYISSCNAIGLKLSLNLFLY